MYYEKKKNNYLGTIIIIGFLIIIIGILLSLLNRLDMNYLVSEEETEETGTEAIAAEFNLENLMKNSIYSVVGISKLNESNTSIFVENSEEKLGIGSRNNSNFKWLYFSKSINSRGKRFKCLCNIEKWR